MVRVRYVDMVRFKNWTELRYAGTVQGVRYKVHKFWTYRSVLPSLLVTSTLCSDAITYIKLQFGKKVRTPKTPLSHP